MGYISPERDRDPAAKRLFADAAATLQQRNFFLGPKQWRGEGPKEGKRPKIQFYIPLFFFSQRVLSFMEGFIEWKFLGPSLLFSGEGRGGGALETFFRIGRIRF